MLSIEIVPNTIQHSEEITLHKQIQQIITALMKMKVQQQQYVSLMTVEFSNLA